MIKKYLVKNSYLHNSILIEAGKILDIEYPLSSFNYRRLKDKDIEEIKEEKKKEKEIVKNKE